MCTHELDLATDSRPRRRRRRRRRHSTPHTSSASPPTAATAIAIQKWAHSSPENSLRNSGATLEIGRSASCDCEFFLAGLVLKLGSYSSAGEKPDSPVRVLHVGWAGAFETAG